MFFTVYYQRCSIAALLLCASLPLQNCQSSLNMAGEEANIPHRAETQQEDGTGDRPAVAQPDSPSTNQPSGQAAAPHASSAALRAAEAGPRQEALLSAGFPAQQAQEGKKRPAKRLRTNVDMSTSPTTLVTPTSAVPLYDVCISHAGEDKATIAAPLQEVLARHGIQSFFDGVALRAGEDASSSMQTAMERALCGVFILSPEFVAKKWPMQVLYRFLKRREVARQQGATPPHLFPVFYRLSREECHTPTVLFDRYSSVFEEYGFHARIHAGETSRKEVCNALEELSKYTGIEVMDVDRPQALVLALADALCDEAEEPRTLHPSADSGYKLRTHYLHDNFALIDPSFPGGSPKHVKDFSCALQLVDKAAAAGGQPSKQRISMEDLFADRSVQPGEDPRTIQKVLIVGDPGTGKTTLSKQLAYRWASGSWGQEFKAVYVLPVRDLPKCVYDNISYRREATLATAIVNHCFTPPVAASAYEALRQEIDRQLQEATTLVVLDGLDERSGASATLIAQAETGDHKLLLLSRAHGIEKKRAMVDIEVKHAGLRASQVRDYVDEVSHLPFAQGVELLSLLRRDCSISALSRVPLNLQTLCFLWRDQSSHAKVRSAIRQGSFSDFYDILVRSIWKHYVSRSQALDCPIEDCIALFDTLGKIGLESLARGETSIRPELVDELTENTSLQYPDDVSLPDTGFLSLQWPENSSEYQFSHPTLREYFGGCWLARQLCVSGEQARVDSEAFLVANKYVADCGRLFSFMAGEVIKEVGCPGLRRLLAFANAGSGDAEYLACLQLQIRLLNEWLCISEEAEASDLLPTLEQEFGIFSGLHEQFAEGIDLVQDYKANTILPLLVEMLEEFRAVGYRVVPSCVSCLLAACDPELSNEYASKICEETLLLLSPLSPSGCFEALEATIRGTRYSVGVRKIAISVLGALTYADATLTPRIVAFLQSMCNGSDQAIYEAAHTAALNAAPRSAALSASPASSETGPLAPSLGFGKEQWSEHFGDVGEEPPLPSNIEETLESACPFWVGRKVRDTHVLVLIPATVDGVPFTLNELGALIREHFPNNAEGYGYYDPSVRQELGSSSPDSSYWILLTQDILLGSRGRLYSAQKALLPGHAMRTGLPYRLPGVLEVSTAILAYYVRTSERLLAGEPETYTYCQETLPDASPSIVGGFGDSGIHILYNSPQCRYSYCSLGISCCWEL